MQNQQNTNDSHILANNEKYTNELKKNINVDIDNESSDDDTYINIMNVLDVQIKNIYQIQINNEIVTIKHIGHGSHVPDIIIKEDFGKQKNLSLYSCVYTNHEIDFLKTEINKDKFLPIIKLVEKKEPENKIYSLSIKVNCLIDYDKPFIDFTIFLTYSTNSTYVYHINLDKNINSTNIIEKMLEKIIELGINIL